MNTLTLQEEALTHIEILTDLLRDIDLEKRMETLIKTENILRESKIMDPESKAELESIRTDLVGDLNQVKLMLCMVEKAQYLIGA